MSDLIERYIRKAKLAEKSGRYNDMYESMFVATAGGRSLSNEERNLFSVAAKSVTAPLLAALDKVTPFTQDKEANALSVQVALEYRSELAAEVEAFITGRVLPRVEEYLAAGAKEPETTVFYQKMYADQQHHRCKYLQGLTRDVALKHAGSSYEKALKTAKDELAPANYLRLGTVLNYTVFLHDIKLDKKHAIDLAKSAFDGGVEGLEAVDDDDYKDSTLMLQLIRENLTLWQEELDEGEGAH